MLKRWERRRNRRVRGVEFCDACSRVCDASCRSAAIRAEALDRVLAMGARR